MAKDQTLRPSLFQNKNVFIRATLTAFKPLSDDSECYRVVGMIAAETARIEHLLDQSIAYLAGLDIAQAACITGQMIGPNPRFTALSQLAKHRGLSADIISSINTVSGHSGPIFERRNRAVHDPWLEDVSTGETYQHRGKPKNRPEFGGVKITLTNIKDDLIEIRKHREEVTSLVSAIWTALQPA